MATTTNYSWTTPDDTDLVKDGASAIRTLGSSADTTVKNLNPGTTAGDIDYYTSSTAKARIGIGTAGQVLAVNAGATAPEWIAAPGGGKVLQVVSAVTTTSTTISTGTMTDTTITATITPSAATSKILVLVSAKVWSTGQNATSVEWNLVRGATDILTRDNDGAQMWYASSSVNTVEYITNPSIIYLDSPNTTSATTYKVQASTGATGSSLSTIFQRGSDESTITLMEIGA
jgi:hypothetical protein